MEGYRISAMSAAMKNFYICLFVCSSVIGSNQKPSREFIVIWLLL